MVDIITVNLVWWTISWYTLGYIGHIGSCKVINDYVDVGDLLLGLLMALGGYVTFIFFIYDVVRSMVDFDKLVKLMRKKVF